MACFIVPVTEAIVTTAAARYLRAKEEKSGKVSFSRKLGWLNKMLWGGSALLAFEHVWHGEVVPVYPFLTAMGSAEGTATMLRELSTSGVAMALLVTAVWAVMVAVSAALEKAPAAEDVRL